MKHSPQRSSHLSRSLQLLGTALLMMVLSGCATLNLEAPRVSVVRIAPVKSTGMEALFELDVRISNPNGIDLPIRGMSYQVAINGTDLLEGVSGNIPTIPAYSSETVTLSLGANMLSAPKILYSLMKNPSDEIRYSFSTKVDLVGALPSFRLVDEGSLPMGASH